MTASHENHEPAQLDEPHDRLLDAALTELIGGAAPPDLSSRIAAATFRQPATASQVSRTRQDRAFWVHLSIAVMLLIGVTIVLVPPLRSVRNREVSMLASMESREIAVNSGGSTSVQSNAPEPKMKSFAKQDRLGRTNLAQKAVITSDGSSAPLPASSNANPNTMQTWSVPELQAQAPNQLSLVTQLNQNIADLAPAAPASTANHEFGIERGTVPAGGKLLWAYSDQPAKPDANGIYFDWKDESSRNRFSMGDLEATRNGIGPGSSGDKYTQIIENPFIKAEGGAAVSTFSIDVDTASYANVRQFLMQMDQLPPPDAVRIEELVNYFQYGYEAPKQSDEAPFAAHVEVAGCPWNPEHRLARVAVKGREMDRNKRPQSNLVFLVDVSGSMNEPAKLPLVVYGLEQLTRELGENDHIAIVVYAGTEGLVLPSTSGSKQDTILAALAKLQAGGSTAGGAGIQLAYQIAEDNFIKGGTNRVILCTDGDFNVGVTNTADLQRLVEQKAKDTGVFLSTLGFGRGNLNDAMMVAISDHGNGNYHYIDSRSEARRVLVQEMTGTLVTIAKDVKIQVEFNPAKVAGYRLIGYEKRMLRTEDFNDDKKDAGEIGAGHTVTALYEIIPAGKKVEVVPIDDLKYQKPAGAMTELADKASPAMTKELLTLKMRYKVPDGDTSKRIEWPITDKGKSFAAASGDLKFAASVAGFGLLLRNSQYKGNMTYAATFEMAQGGIGEDPHGYRKEFLDMVRKAKELRHE